MTKASIAAEWFAEALQEKFENESPFAMKLFSVHPGRVYDKIVQNADPSYSSGQSVHAFVDRISGAVHKPASWRAPVGAPSYPDPVMAIRFATIHGGYLYSSAARKNRAQAEDDMRSL